VRTALITLFWIVLLVGSNAFGPLWNWLAVVVFVVWAFLQLRPMRKPALVSRSQGSDQQHQKSAAAPHPIVRRWR
jgi:hypothetical protein